MTFRRALAAGLVSGVLFALAAPPLGWGFLLFAAWIPLLWGAGRSSSWKEAAVAGAAFGLAYYASLFSWIVRLEWWLYAAAVLTGAAFGAAVAASVWRVRLWPAWSRALAVASIWSLPIWLCNNPVRPFFGTVVFLSGLHAPLPSAFLQLARPLGETGLVFFLVLLNALTWQALEARKAAPLVIAGILGAAAWGWGAARVRAYDARTVPSPTFTLACAQTDLPFALTWRAAHQEELFKTYEGLALDAAAKGANMVVFPQYQLPEDIYRRPGRWGELARKTKLYIALGTDTPVEPLFGQYAWVHALVFSPDGKVVGDQPALHPSPVGRPMVVPGKQEVPVPIPGLGTVGLLPCFDDVTSRPARLSSLAGADYLLSMANDGLFVGTIHPRLHMIRSRLRAVENDKYLVRCVPNGISAVIDPLGRVRDSLPAGKGLLFAHW